MEIPEKKHHQIKNHFYLFLGNDQIQLYSQYGSDQTSDTELQPEFYIKVSCLFYNSRSPMRRI